MKILIIQFYRLGDVLQTTPVLQALKKKYGEVSIDFVVDETCYPVIKDNPYIDRVIILPRAEITGEGGRGGLAGSIRKTLFFAENIMGVEYDLAINYNFEPAGGILLDCVSAGEKRGLLYRNGKYILLDAWTKYFFSVNGRRNLNRMNIADVFRFIAGCGDARASLYLKKNGQEGIIKSRFLDFERKAPVIAVQGAASRQLRSLTAGQIRGLIGLLNPEYNIALLGSRGEEHMFADLKDGPGFRNLTAKTTIGELTGVIGCSDLLISPDTFAIHAAAALKVRTVAYFLAGAVPHVTGPYSENAVDVFPEIDCGPCDTPGSCGNVKCGNGIDGRLLYSLACDVLNGTNNTVLPPGIAAERPKIGGFAYFGQEHKRQIEGFISEIDLINKGKIPTINSGKSVPEGSGGLRRAITALERNLAGQTGNFKR